VTSIESHPSFFSWLHFLHSTFVRRDYFSECLFYAITS